MMKILSCWEPWSSCIAMGKKLVETRSWSTSYRGWIINHASKGGLSNTELLFTLEEHPFSDLGITMEDLRPGHILSVARLSACVPTNGEFLGLVSGEKTYYSTWDSPLERSLGDYSKERYGWVLSLPFRLPQPIPFKARQGLFDAPEEIVGEIDRQAREAQIRTPQTSRWICPMPSECIVCGRNLNEHFKGKACFPIEGRSVSDGLKEIDRILEESRQEADELFEKLEELEAGVEAAVEAYGPGRTGTKI